MFTQVSVLLGLIASLNGTPVERHEIYMRGMEIVSLNYDTDVVTCIDAVGFEWEFTGCEDYCKNDIVCALMDNMGTPENIFDDAILDVNYSGYWTEKN